MERKCLFPVFNHDIFHWEHEEILNFIAQPLTRFYLKYVSLHGGNRQRFQEISKEIGILVANGNVFEAYSSLVIL